jgi:hypothetical protein
MRRRRLVRQQPVFELLPLRRGQRIACEQVAISTAECLCVLVSRGSPGTAEFNAVSHRCSRELGSPMLRANAVMAGGPPMACERSAGPAIAGTGPLAATAVSVNPAEQRVAPRQSDHRSQGAD